MEGKNKKQSSLLWRLILPLIYAAGLVLVCNWITGSFLIEIEDRYANLILGGAYGAYDPYVPAINPWLGRLVTLLYGLIPSVNWFGVLLLSLIGLAGATVISLAARRPGGFLPGVVLMTPILIVLTASVQSQVVAALCLVAGMLSIMDGIQKDGQSIARVIVGALLCAAAVMLALELSWLLAACLLICCLATKWRNTRLRVIIPGAIVVAIALGLPTLLGLVDTQWRTYHTQYLAYDQAQQSPMRAEVDELLGTYGMIIDLDGGTSSLSEEDEGSTSQDAAVANTNFNKALGWSLNDADMFVRRISVDTDLVAPEAVAALNQANSRFSTNGLLENLWTTIKKMQFLMLLALFLVAALVLQVTNRRKGALALLTAVITFGGHIGMVAMGYTSFCDIAPFYLLGIITLLYSYDGKASGEWVRRIIRPRVLRALLAVVVLVGFVGCVGGLGYMMRQYNQEESPSVAAAEELYALMDQLPDAVFIGDNPIDRYNPNALTPPAVGSDARMLAGSYDLYSSRRADIMAQYNLNNPMVDGIDREDVLYVDISGANLYIIANRMYEAHGIIIQADVPTVNGEPWINTASTHRMQVYKFISKTEAEFEQIMADQAAQQLAELEAHEALHAAEGEDAHSLDDGHNHTQEELDALNQPSPEPTATDHVEPTATPVAP